jgi:hypothetical protein
MALIDQRANSDNTSQQKKKKKRQEIYAENKVPGIQRINVVGNGEGTRLHLIPMLRTRPMETRSSIACQVVSKDMVVSMSSTLFSSRMLAVVPTPVCIWIWNTTNNIEKSKS